MNENQIDALSSIIHPCEPPSWSNFWQGVAEATHHLLTSDDYAGAINQALAILGRVTAADRVYIFEIYLDPETGIRESSLRFEWVQETVSAVDNLQLHQPIHPVHSMSQWCKTLFWGHSIGGPVRELPDALQQILAPQGILSVLVIPIRVNSKLWGLIGFEDRHTERQWSKDEQAILTTMAANVGASLAKLNVESTWQQSQLQLQNSSAKVPGLIYKLLQRSDGSQSISFVSSGCRSLYEVEPEAAAADFQVIADLIHPHDCETFYQSLAVSAATMQPWNWEGRIITPSGQFKWLQGASRPEQQVNGDILWNGLFIDITSAKRTESALQESEKRLRRQNRVLMALAKSKTLNQGNLEAAVREIAEAAARTLEIERVSVWLCNDHPTRITCIDLYEQSANRHSSGMELAAVDYPAYFKALGKERTIAAHNAYTDPRTREFSESYLQPLGITSMLDAPIWLGGQMVGIVCHEQTGSARLWALEEQNFAGSIADLVSLAMEASAAREAEAALWQSEHLYRTLARNLPNGAVFLFDQNLRYTIAEGAGLAAIGLSKELLEGKTIWEAWSSEICAIMEPNYRAALTGTATVTEVAHGNRVYVLHTLPVRNESGEIFAGMTMSLDITESKQAQEALRKSEAENRALLNAIPDLLLRIAQDGTYLSVRGEKDSDFLMPRSQMVGKKVYEVLPKEVAAQRMHYIEQALCTGETQIFEHQLLNHGEMRDYEVRIIKSGEAEVLMIIRDITERKQAEIQQRLLAQRVSEASQRARLLAQMQERIRRSLNLEQILNTTVTEVRQFLQADRVYICQMDGTEPGRIVAESVDAHWRSLLGKKATHVEHLRKTLKLFEGNQVHVVDDVAQTVDSPKISHDYTEAPVKTLLAVPILLEEKLFGLLVADQCSQPRRWQPIEIDLLQALSTQLSIAIHQSLLYQQLAKLNTNLEQQVEARTQELQQKMQELQELNQLKDVFLHALTHEMRTPFMGWSMALRNLLNNQETTISISRSILERMVQSSDRQLHLINLLLEIHSVEVENLVLEQEPVQLSQIIDAVAEDLKPLFAKNQATLTNLTTNALPIVSADPRQLRRVLENLLTYTLEHNPPGLNLTLGATTRRKMMRFTLHYDGVGMSQETCEHLFKLYIPGSHIRRLTVSRLGLYLCWQIIAAHGGKIGATTTQGARSTFWFTLPL